MTIYVLDHIGLQGFGIQVQYKCILTKAASGSESSVGESLPKPLSSEDGVSKGRSSVATLCTMMSTEKSIRILFSPLTIPTIRSYTDSYLK